MAIRTGLPPPLALGYTCELAGIVNRYLQSAGMTEPAFVPDSTVTAASVTAANRWMRQYGLRPAVPFRWGRQAWEKLRAVMPDIFQEAMDAYHQAMSARAPLDRPPDYFVYPEYHPYRL